MAPSPAAGPSSLARPSSSHLSHAGGVLQPVPLQPQGRRHRRRAPGVARAAPDAPPVVRAAVSAVTELLRALSPSKKPRQRDAAQEDEEPDPPPCGSVEDVLAVLEDDYRRAYFLTGDFTPGIYTEDCLFEDPTIKFRGLSRYSQNLDQLVPFFDSPSLELENIEKDLRVDTRFVKATWKLRTYLRLPWRPLIAIRDSEGTQPMTLTRITRWFGTLRAGTSLRSRPSARYSCLLRSSRKAAEVEVWNVQSATPHMIRNM